MSLNFNDCPMLDNYLPVCENFYDLENAYSQESSYIEPLSFSEKFRV